MSLAEIGRWPAEDLPLWSAAAEKKRELEDLKWDARIFCLGVMIRSALRGAAFDPAPFLPALFAGAAAGSASSGSGPSSGSSSGSGPITDPKLMRDIAYATAAAAGRIAKPKETDHGK